ncbi:MAG: AraC family transcriptional regulator [Leadbetterella sp.]|nr:AraC family transcriptional regulator [Leadbetterella sp.]
MKEKLFKTFKPSDPRIAAYVDYYYLDIKPFNEEIEIDCFPHYKTAVSFYASHSRSENGDIVYQEGGKPFQAFTPVHDDVLKVRQVGFVHRVVMVFKPLGIFHFTQKGDFTTFIYDFDFLEERELNLIFNTTDPDSLTRLLDGALLSRYRNVELSLIQHIVNHIFEEDEDFSVEKLSAKLNYSRQYLNRVCRQYIGVSVKRFREIVRFRKAIDQKLLFATKENLTSLAHQFNYNDQSHFIKVCRNLTGNAPGPFFKRGKLLGSEDTFWHIRD